MMQVVDTNNKWLKPRTVDKLRAAIVAGFDQLNQNQAEIEYNRACLQGVKHRTALCVQEEGNHFEQFRQGK